MLIHKCEVHYDTFYAFATATGIASQLLKLLLLLLALLPSCRQAEEHQLLGHFSATACDNKHRQASRQAQKHHATGIGLASLSKPITTRCVDHNCTQHICTAHLQNTQLQCCSDQCKPIDLVLMLIYKCEVNYDTFNEFARLRSTDG